MHACLSPFAMGVEDYLMENLIDLIESLRYLNKLTAADERPVKDRQVSNCCLKMHSPLTCTQRGHGIIFTAVV